MTRNLLLFDLDGTLVDSAMGIAKALSVVSRNRGGSAIGPEEVRPLVSRGAPELVRRTLGDRAGQSTADLIAFRAALAEQASDPNAIYPGVVAALKSLRDRGFQMAIVTNKPESLGRKLLSELHLSSFFATIVGGDSASACKPDPAPVHTALAHLNADAGAAIFIGDSEVDAETARRCRMPFLLFEGGYGGISTSDGRVFGSFARFQDLPALIAAIEALPPNSLDAS